MFLRLNTVAACLLLLACAGADGQAGADTAEADGTTGDAVGQNGGDAARSGGTRAAGPCALFTREEIGRMLGRGVDEGYVAGPMDTACQWDSPTDEDAYASVQVISDTQYWETRSGVRGYETHAGVAQEAFTAPELGGWIAGARTETRIVFTSVNGGNASRDLALEMLRTALQRLER